MLALFSKLLQDPPKEKLRLLDRLFAGPSGRFAPAPVCLRRLFFFLSDLAKLRVSGPTLRS